MATIRDVAKMAKVSISTVSLAFNEGARVSVETRKKVLDAAKNVGYAPNPLAQNLKRGHARLIGVVLGDVTNPFFGHLLKEIERLALESNHLVIMCNSDADPARELAILSHLEAQRVAGVILSPHGHHPQYVEALQKFEMPIVTIDQKIKDLDVDYVASDNLLTGAMQTEHVIRFGHKRIAHIGGIKELWTATQRLQGFYSTMQAAGIEIDESLVVEGHYDGQCAYECTLRLLIRPDRPTAIIAASNVMALGALKAINDLGFKCPDDISLVSVDDVPWSEVIQPSITTVKQEIDDIARIATESLMNRINNRTGPALNHRDHILTPKLVIGQSCAAPPVEGANLSSGY